MADLNRFDLRLQYISSGILSAIARIDELKGMWTAGAKLNPVVLNRLKQSVLVTSTGASTRIEGARLSVENIEKTLSVKQLSAWEYLQKVRQASPLEISQNAGIARPTVNQVVSKLIRLKRIERIGLGRSTRYRIINTNS